MGQETDKVIEEARFRTQALALELPPDVYDDYAPLIYNLLDFVEISFPLIKVAVVWHTDPEAYMNTLIEAVQDYMEDLADRPIRPNKSNGAR